MKSNLTRLELELFNSKECNKLFGVIDILYARDANDELVEYVYDELIKKSMDFVAQHILEHKKIAFKDDDNICHLRAIYQKGFNEYENGNFVASKELFLLLHDVSDDDDFSFSMGLHALACMDRISAREFIDKFCDIENMRDDEFFILNFKEDAKEYYDSNIDRL